MKLSVADFLLEQKTRPVFDVRSPGEFEHGHIPGAISFPLFSDAERAEVGTCYKQVGKEQAFELGLRIVGPKMADFVQQAKVLAPDRQLAVHCWRGGQRSGSMAWLFRQAGFDVVTLDGGYKNYRQHVLQYFETVQLPLRVVGGSTGTGKTKILWALRELGEQIIDLEGLAHHKGSAFGFIGEQLQPTVEQFENQLFTAIQHIDPTRRIWIENESRSIGRIFIPPGFWTIKTTAPLYNIEIPLAVRIQNLLDDYVLEQRDELAVAFKKIETKLGGLHYKTAIAALESGDFAAAASIALVYYDKTYQHCLDTTASTAVHQLVFDHGDPKHIAGVLAEMA